MNIMMMTNTYLPHVGGVARSVETLSSALQELGHSVMIVAPEFPNWDASKDADNVVRVPAIQKFNGSDFSVRLPVPFVLEDHIDSFDPDIFHSHHPFLLGDTAIRKAYENKVPVVFTHHTLYERYTHYVPVDSPAMKQMAKDLSTGYANMCQGVIAPSESIRQIIQERGVKVPINVIPTGIDPKRFRKGSGRALRKEFLIPPGHRVLGHVGRFAEEKNLDYLIDAIVLALTKNKKLHMLMVGDGPKRKTLEEKVRAHRLRGRIHFLGTLQGDALVEAYKAMDVFVFSSHTETQGMVVAEAMMSGLPVVALNASGVREVVKDGENGVLLRSNASVDAFSKAVLKLAKTPSLAPWQRAARATSKEFEKLVCAKKCVDFYEDICERYVSETRDEEPGTWGSLLGRIEAEWKLLQGKTRVVRTALRRTESS